ncbi:MAG TPA: hypothetical protein VGX46_12890 [Vicinamibacterales bacterium]|nr:hypothetical protein [Vicinamibacterales bacterium]
MGTVSSKVRRARSSRGTLVGAPLAVFGREMCFPAGFLVARGLTAFEDADRRTDFRLLLGRLTERLADTRFAARRPGLARFAVFFAFLAFRFAIGFILSQP